MNNRPGQEIWESQELNIYMYIYQVAGHCMMGGARTPGDTETGGQVRYRTQE